MTTKIFYCDTASKDSEFTAYQKLSLDEAAVGHIFRCSLGDIKILAHEDLWQEMFTDDEFYTEKDHCYFYPKYELFEYIGQKYEIPW